ncbi:Plug and carboxypeptidase regulatory-like domain-containing protein [Nubsella zeaxanthinifaciens]|uniref:Plug and carboxypeptidase regulatory-like domain-containing protein n=1 Tax=Nubsella zeaxanthinifaciens TaxID=392412 RepID=UPI000DE3C7ED|nr:Plug and carboxypeptidase regulatory-like domain-containing protein [Nubsella zeaxanthinifaciens]
MIHKRSLYFILLLLCTQLANAQEKNIDALLQRLAQYTTANAQEKVHLHLDKPYYAIGDDIWFKAYVVNAKTGFPSNISNVLYVELINETDNVAKALKLPLTRGISWGNFNLIDSLKEGNYRIRAYTQWMRNNGADFLFDKTIKIGNSWANNVFTMVSHVVNKENEQQKVSTTIQFTDKFNTPYIGNNVSYEVKIGTQTALSGKATTNNEGKITLNINYKTLQLNQKSFLIASLKLPNNDVVRKEIPLIGISKDVDIQILPEGGSYVANLPNKMAVKIVGSNGLGVTASGTLTDKNGTEVAKFETNKVGIGAFVLNPLLNEIYTANISFKDNVQRTVKLPLADKNGIVLSVNNLETSVMGVKVYLSESLLNKDDYYLVAQKNGIVYFSKKIASDKQVVSLSVPKNNFPSGVLTLTLFSANLTPLSERIVFVNNFQDKIAIATEQLNATYGTRQKVDFSLLATNKEEPVQGSFSIAVTNTSAIKPDPENESNIWTQLLLTADLKGYVEKPNYYFLNQDKNTLTDLDNLMLSQGWRKIDWNKINADNKDIPLFKPEKSLQISGTVTKGGKPVINGKVTLASLKGKVFAVDTLTDKNGHFVFDQIELTDTLRYVVQARTEKDKKFVTITLDASTEQTVTPNPNTGDIEVNINQTLNNYLSASKKYLDDQTKKGFLNKTIQLNQVNIVKRRPTSKQFEELMLPGIIDISVNAKDLEKAVLLSRYLMSIVPNLTVTRGQLQVPRRSVVIFIDGLRYNLNGSDYDIDNIDVTNIKTLEILKQSQGYAANGVGPDSFVVVITTKTGTGLSSTSQYTPGVVKNMLIGYDTVKTFYSPKYDVTPNTDPDLRTTVFWEPKIITDSNGKANISYFNTDLPGMYRIVIEGIDGTGNLARKVINYEVK